jgi:hypothetical protein
VVVEDVAEIRIHHREIVEEVVVAVLPTCLNMLEMSRYQEGVVVELPGKEVRVVPVSIPVRMLLVEEVERAQLVWQGQEP